ncbi:MAG: hypothetical protein Q9228_000277 [Teloschistes exilis]
MFDILEADIVVFQESKIQRKDLVDDMVLIPGWDCYWSLPKHKKGVALLPFREDNADLDATTLDSEGRCVILEFPAFVLLGVYSPANRDETRNDFRLGFLDLLDARVRNLVALGKRVLLTGDLNISREELDTANADAAMRKNGFTPEDFISTPARRMFNQLLEGGKVIGERDTNRENPIMWDICRGFHPSRKGMFTCWEQKVNARPGNCGSRIDYVLCSLSMKSWFSESNIQEGLMGSDHCPVYAVMKDKIEIEDRDIHALDIMNPSGMFVNGQRQRDYSAKDMLPMSGKLIPEFDGRRSIKDMFSRKSSLPTSHTPVSTLKNNLAVTESLQSVEESSTMQSSQADRPPPGSNNGSVGKGSILPSIKKRPLADSPTGKVLKRSKSRSTASATSLAAGGQQSLKGFFQSTGTTRDAPPTSALVPVTAFQKDDAINDVIEAASDSIPGNMESPLRNYEAELPLSTNPTPPIISQTKEHVESKPCQSSPLKHGTVAQDAETIHDPVQSKESWSKLFTKPAAPRCEGHEEPCKTMLTKKSGMNCGSDWNPMSAAQA